MSIYACMLLRMLIHTCNFTIDKVWYIESKLIVYRVSIVHGIGVGGLGGLAKKYGKMNAMLRF